MTELVGSSTMNIWSFEVCDSGPVCPGDPIHLTRIFQFKLMNGSVYEYKEEMPRELFSNLHDDKNFFESWNSHVVCKALQEFYRQVRRV